LTVAFRAWIQQPQLDSDGLQVFPTVNINTVGAAEDTLEQQKIRAVALPTEGDRPSSHFRVDAVPVLEAPPSGTSKSYAAMPELAAPVDDGDPRNPHPKKGKKTSGSLWLRISRSQDP
jgi:hypothetical protein